MRYILILMLLTSSLNLHALCMFGPNTVNVYPTSKKIPRNVQLVIESGGFILPSGMRYVFDSIPVYLIAGKDSIRMATLNRSFRYASNNQFVFSTQFPLKANTKYLLKVPYFIDDSLAYFTKWFETTDEIDQAPPKWKRKPKLFKTSFAMYGCGDEKLLYFGYELNNKEQHVVQIDVLDSKRKKHQTLFLPFDDESIIFGETMCDYNVEFDSESTYLITFNLVDAAGNCDLKSIQPIFFNGEFEEKDVNDEVTSQKDPSIGFYAFISISFVFLILMVFLIFRFLRKRKTSI
ncbi:MAG: hypothetical protein IT221_11835 [Fluviicola sp.]|nr:hypothetical protein [Fluviicola sp.]